MMLGVVHEGIAFPLLWTMLDKPGNSNSDQPMDGLERFEALFPDAEIVDLSGEPEFIG